MRLQRWLSLSQARTYPLVDRDGLAAKVKAAGGPAIDPTHSLGKATADGVTIGWNTTGNQILVTILDKPWVVPYSAIWSHIDAILD